MIGTYYHIPSGAVTGYGQVADDYSHPELPTATEGIFHGVADGATEYVISATAKAPRVDYSISAPALVTTGTPVTVTLPNPCWGRTDGGELREFTGTFSFTPTVARTYRLELVGQYRGDAAVVVESAEQNSLRNDPRWVALQTATPQQVEDWLTANVTTLASARQVLKILLLAVRKLGA